MTDDNRYRASPEQWIELQSVGGPTLRALVRELRVQIHPHHVRVEADFQIDGADYFRSMDEGHFALDTPVRGEGPDPHTETPVRLTAYLRPAIAEKLRSDDPMPALLAQLFEAPAPFAHTDAWRATDVTQQIDELGLSLGYRTVWAEEG